MTLFSKLQRVRNEVEQHLPQSSGVSIDGGWYILTHIQNEFEFAIFQPR
jgi:hypothetical protein